MDRNSSLAGEEVAIRKLISESAAWGARVATFTALTHAKTISGTPRDAIQVPIGPVVGPQYKTILLGDAILVSSAAEAVSRAAEAGVAFLEPGLHLASWPRLSDFEFTEYRLMLQKLEAAATSSAISAIYALAALHARSREGILVDDLALLELSLTGTVISTMMRQACVGVFTEKKAPVENGNRWAGLLVPLLAACLPTASAAYPHLANKPVWIVIWIYGTLMLLIFILMLGIAAVVPPSLQSRYSSESLSRHATFFSFLLIVGLGSSVASTMSPDWGFHAGVIVVGLVAVSVLAILWWYSGKPIITDFVDTSQSKV